MNQPRLGWWVQLVGCSAFGRAVRSAVLNDWCQGLSGNVVGEIIWLPDDPQPAMLMVYGTAEDIPPDFEEMAEVVQPLMGDDQYFAFVFMKDTMLATGGLECVIITKNSLLRVNGRLMINSAVESALTTDAKWRLLCEQEIR